MTVPSEPSNAQEGRPISIVGAFLVSALVMVVLMLVLAGVGALMAVVEGVPFEQAFQRATTQPVNLGLAQVISLLFALWVGVARYHPASDLTEALNVRPVPRRAIGLAFVSGFALQFPMAELGNQILRVWPAPPGAEEQLLRLLEIHDPVDALRVLIMFVIIAPVGEELLFRGLLQPGLARSHGPKRAVVVTALLFGMSHMQPAAAVISTLAGVIFGVAMLRSGSTLATIALHAGFNSAPVLLQRSILRIEGFNTIGEDVYHQPALLWVSAALVACLCLWAFFRIFEEESA